MVEGLVELAEEALTSPWAYVALFGFSAIDAFFPIAPSESVVITAGVFSASEGEPALLGVIAASAAGAFAGDHISYYIGRAAGPTVLKGSHPESRRRKAFDTAAEAFARRGGLVLFVARYIPFGRTATTMTMGASGYPRSLFSAFDALAAISWALYSALLGYLGGATFEEDPLLGLAMGMGLALATTVAVEGVRYLRRRRAPA
jgi:membrane protein DedA with SNARE-associated domain